MPLSREAFEEDLKRGVPFRIAFPLVKVARERYRVSFIVRTFKPGPPSSPPVFFANYSLEAGVVGILFLQIIGDASESRHECA
jgi:hypothetical protein